MKKTKIVCTIGPASESVETLVKLMNAGMNVARLNFSHGDFEEHGARIVNIREASKITGKMCAILLDTKGPEIRTNNMKDGIVSLITGETVRISMTEVEGTKDKFSITYPELINDVVVGNHILLDDGLIDLEVTELDRENNEIVTLIKNSGILKNKKGVNLPGIKTNFPGLTQKDADDIIFGIENDVDFIAASFVRRASDVLAITEILEKHNATHIQIIPKIENQEGLDNIDEILQVSQGLMVARGDLGVEIPTEEVPIAQKMLIKKCNALGKPVITATQMLDSMQRNPRPTRAEAGDVANQLHPQLREGHRRRLRRRCEAYSFDPAIPIIQAYGAHLPRCSVRSRRCPPACAPRPLSEAFSASRRRSTAPSTCAIRRCSTTRKTSGTSPRTARGGQTARMQPYYTIMELPGEEKPEFLLMLPFTPRNKDNMVAWMVARSDGAHYGELVVFKLPKQGLIFGPMQVEARIDQDQVISRRSRSGTSRAPR